MHFLRMVHGSYREQRKCRHVPEGHPSLFLEASIRLVQLFFLTWLYTNCSLILAVDDLINNAQDKLKKGAEGIFKKD